MAFPTKSALSAQKSSSRSRINLVSPTAARPAVPPNQLSRQLKRQMDADERKAASEVSEARRQAMRELLYRKDS